METPEGSRAAPMGVCLAVWLLPQLAIFAIGAGHVPLWLGLPMRMDEVVLPQLLCVQIVVAVMFFPVVLVSWESTVAAILINWPMIAAAGFVSATPVAQWIGAGVYVSLLAAGLGVWNDLLRPGRARLIGAGVATAVTLGGILLTYLHVEFSGSSAAFFQPGHAAHYNAILGVLSQLKTQPPADVWWMPCLVFAGGLFATCVRRFIMMKQRSMQVGS